MVSERHTFRVSAVRVSAIFLFLLVSSSIGPPLGLRLAQATTTKRRDYLKDEKWANEQVEPAKPVATKPVATSSTIASCATGEGPRGLFVRGLHHGGTTLTAKLLSLHMDVSSVTNGGRYEDEGQHVQATYPKVGARTSKICRGDVYRCPSMALSLRANISHGSAVDATAKQQWAELCASWLPHVADPSKRFFLEKDPDLAAGYLAAVASRGSSIALVIRHPLNWRNNFGRLGKRRGAGIVPKDTRRDYLPECSSNGAHACPLIWLDVWGRTLGDLAGRIGDESRVEWAIVRFEAVVSDPRRALKELLPLLGLFVDNFPFGRVAHELTPRPRGSKERSISSGASHTTFGAARKRRANLSRSSRYHRETNRKRKLGDRRRLEFHADKQASSSLSGTSAVAESVEVDRKYLWSLSPSDRARWVKLVAPCRIDAPSSQHNGPKGLAETHISPCCQFAQTVHETFGYDLGDQRIDWEGDEIFLSSSASIDEQREHSKLDAAIRALRRLGLGYDSAGGGEDSFYLSTDTRFVHCFDA